MTLLLYSLQPKRIFSLYSSNTLKTLIGNRISNNKLCNYPRSASALFSSKSGNSDGNSAASGPASSQTTSSDNLKRKYTDTLLLPKTDFPMKISYEKRDEHELSIANKCQFEQMYGFQRLWRQGQPEFVLHDGPPYANGDVHIGHAVNKILKDITNRYKLLRGYQVNYTPGWDCHGLPIELKSVRDEKRNILTDPIKIRNAARSVVDQSIASQIEAFKRWGILAEWNSPYRTIDKTYVKTQLQTFLKLYEKELVYRDLKPVFWSPSSKTALAEAELEYYPAHESPSVYLALDLNTNVKNFLSKIGQESSVSLDSNAKVQAIIWTTTPWTLPANKAIAFHESEKYSLLDARQGHTNAYYIVASSLLDQFFVEKNIKYNVLLEFSGKQLGEFKYSHPWFESEMCPFVHGDHVTMEKGTGLVHIAPAHGHDDYVLGLKHKLKLECYVDNDGNFDSTIPKLKGMSALSIGNKTIINELKNKIVSSSTIKHSYPYDWRTKQPVIVKTSMQWFINTESLKIEALEHLNKVNIYPKNVQNGMLAQLLRRPYWCISRQRVWGVPIPVLYHKETGKPLIQKNIVDKMCELIDVSGNVDGWWDAPISSILEDETKSQQYEKGKDIFDIWYDSGISWHILGGDRIADLYLEGKDQFQGWFQSSLLMSTALRNCSPYKNLYVHGFVVDEEGKKMSKSVGNVVNPLHVVKGRKEKNQPAYGADVLRWWVATQGSTDGGNISVSLALLRSSDESVQKIRNVLKFLISFCNESSAAELNLENITYDELMYTDQYMLSLLRDFRIQVSGHYDEYNYHRALMKTLHFATTNVSAQYFTWVKDRLYCDFKQSQSRKSCIFVLSQIYLTFSKILGPVLPFLVEESYSHYKLGNHSIFKSLWFDENKDKIWDNSSISTTFELALDVRETLNHVIGANNPKDIWVELQCNAENFKKLQILHPISEDELDKCDSELCDILQVSGVDLKCYEKVQSASTVEDDPSLRVINFSINPVGVGHSLTGFSVGICKTEMMQCARCRRHCCTPGEILCNRCLSVMKGVLQKKSQEEISAARSQPEISKRTTN